MSEYGIRFSQKSISKCQQLFLKTYTCSFLPISISGASSSTRMRIKHALRTCSFNLHFTGSTRHSNIFFTFRHTNTSAWLTVGAVPRVAVASKQDYQKDASKSESENYSGDKCGMFTFFSLFLWMVACTKKKIKNKKPLRKHYIGVYIAKYYLLNGSCRLHLQ